MPWSVTGIKLICSRWIQFRSRVSRVPSERNAAKPFPHSWPTNMQETNRLCGSWIHQEEEISVPSLNRNENWVNSLLECETMETFCRRPFHCKMERIWIPVSLIGREWSRKLPIQKHPHWVLFWTINTYFIKPLKKKFLAPENHQGIPASVMIYLASTMCQSHAWSHLYLKQPYKVQDLRSSCRVQIPTQVSFCYSLLPFQELPIFFLTERRKYTLLILWTA